MEWALLHHADDLAEARARSDADLVAAGSIAEVVRSLAAAPLASRGLGLVMVWPYDVGSASLFVVRRERPGGAQLDVTVDAAGRGAYGLRAPRFLERTATGGRWPVVDPLDGLVYRLVKRLRKGDPDARARVLAEARASDRALLVARSREVLAPPAARALADALAGDPVRRTGRARPATFVRLMARVRRPVGVWIHADREPVPVDLPAAFSGVIPHVEIASPRAVGDIVVLRYRAALVFTAGRLPPMLRPDLTFGSFRYQTLVEALERRVAGRWQVG